MRILVTGASGFVGRALTRSLAAVGYRVRAAARDSASIRPAELVEPVALPDLSRRIDWRPLLDDVDAVVHCAGIAHASAKVAEEQYERVNLRATKDLALTASLMPQVRRLVFLSSIRAQSGAAADHVLTESDAPQPTDAYGRSKLAAETFVRGYGVPATILRPVVVYGPGVRANVAQLARIARLPLPLPLRGLTARRSLLARDNLLSAIRFVLEHPATAGETYIVADPTSVSVAEAIAIMRRARGRAPRLFHLPPAWLRALLRVGGRVQDWERIALPLEADIGKLRAAGWTPPTDALQALTQMVRRPRP